MSDALHGKDCNYFVARVISTKQPNSTVILFNLSFFTDTHLDIIKFVACIQNNDDSLSKCLVTG